MNLRMLAIDLDGTLLNSSKLITPTTTQTLKEAQRRGISIVLATARPPRSVLPYYTQLALTTPVIAYNGALVIHPPTAKVLLHRPIGASIATQVCSLTHSFNRDFHVSAEIMDHWYAESIEDSPMGGASQWGTPQVVAPASAWLNRPVTKMLIFGQPEYLTSLTGTLKKQFSGVLSTVQTENDILQVMHNLASKARSLRFIAMAMGIGREHTMAIGDNSNDMGMLQWSALSVAMEGANEHALAAADYVTESNDADGVANAVRRAVFDNLPPGRPVQQEH